MSSENINQNCGNDNGNGDDSEKVKDDIRQRSLNLLKREIAVLERENELLKRMGSLNISSPIDSKFYGGGQQHIPVDLLKELIPSYNGETDFNFWATQIRSVRDEYNVEEKLLRAVIGSKLSGKALSWFHGNVEFVTMTVEMLLTKMSDHFGTKENKLALRRRFESRIWKFGENFAEYYNEKTNLSFGLQMDEAELIDYIIEGIPDENLRVQAHLQCFTSKTQMLQAFLKISLKSSAPKRQGLTQKPSAEVRCYNCSEMGHYASACK